MVTGAKQIRGVVSIRVDALEGKLWVRYDTALTTEATVLAAVNKVIDEVH